MKNQHVIAYLTVMLIIFQSFSAIANLQDFHVMNTEHLQHEHQHDIEHRTATSSVNSTVNNTINSAEQNVDDSVYAPSDASKSTTKTDTEHHNPADCHHCGHCHGTHIQWLGQAALQSAQAIQQSHQFYYLTGMFDSPVNRLLRPPKQ